MPRKPAPRTIAACIVALMLASTGHRAGFATELPSVAGLLDRYRSGAFDASVAELSAEGDSEAFRTKFISDADAWIASESADVAQRRFVVAAFAVEVAQARLSHDNPSLVVLLDWANKELRKGSPSAAERVWILAAVALMERGGINSGLSLALSRILATVPARQRWGVEFIENAVKRFPTEPRLRLAQTVVTSGISVRRDLERLAVSPVVGADALVQRAYLELANRNYPATIDFARRAADAASEPYSRYLAHFLIAFCHEATGRPVEAVSNYSAALRAVPHAQSASIALSRLLMRDNQANAAFDLIDHSLAEHPAGDDPWRLFAYGGYMRWPVLVADLRRAVR